MLHSPQEQDAGWDSLVQPPSDSDPAPSGADSRIRHIEVYAATYQAELRSRIDEIEELVGGTGLDADYDAIQRTMYSAAILESRNIDVESPDNPDLLRPWRTVSHAAS